MHKKLSIIQKLIPHWFIVFIILAASQIGCSLIENTSLTIRWTTESELDTVGFNLYRSDSADGEFIKINDELIPPAADPFIGGEHIFVDENVIRGKTYYYQLETVDRNGNTTRTESIELEAGQ